MKKNSPTNPTIAMCLAGAMSSVVSLQSGAFQLGQIQGASRIDEPLSAYINLMMSPRESQLETSIAVLPDFNYRYDPVMNDALSAMTATLVRNEYGHHYIALSSSRKLNLPLISFRLEARNGENTLVQHFSLAPRPPLPSIVQQPKATLSTRRRDSTPSLTIARQPEKPSNLAGVGEYGPVKAGDTLWKIATRVAGSDAAKVLNQIFELNPQAFINGDINKLRQGVVLTLPSTDSKTAPTVVDSVTVVAGNPSPAASSIVASTREELTLSIEDPTSIIEAESTLIEDGRFAENSDFEIEKSGAGDLLDTGISTANNAGKVALALTATDSLDWRAENP